MRRLEIPVAILVGSLAAGSCNCGDDRPEPRQRGNNRVVEPQPASRKPFRRPPLDLQRSAQVMVEALERGAIGDRSVVASDHGWRRFGAGPRTSRQPAAANQLRAALEDLELTPTRILAASDRVLVEATLTGKHIGELAGVSATDKRVAARAFYLGRLRDGEIVESIAYLAEESLAAQIADRGRPLKRATNPLEFHQRPTGRPLDPDGFQELHRITAFAVAARAGRDRHLQTFALGEMSPGEVARRLPAVGPTARSSRMTIGIREIFTSGPFAIARFRLGLARAAGGRADIDALTVARVRRGRVQNARVYADVTSRIR